MTSPQDQATVSASARSELASAPYSQQTMDELREIAARYPQPRSALLPMLHLVQSIDGCVTPRGIEVCAELLSISAAEVSGVATFYTMYKRRPVGDYHVGVCTNTLCAVMGGDAIFERLKGHLDVGNDETTVPTQDGEASITLEHVECNAACDYAPVMMVNWEFFDNQTPESAVRVVDELRSGAKVEPSRGATVVTWRDAERVLAGFPDGLVDEGPAAGAASLVGLELARERSWTAPSNGNGPGDRPAKPAGQDSGVAGAAQADTSRAESEAEVEQSDADTHEDAKPTSNGTKDNS